MNRPGSLLTRLMGWQSRAPTCSPLGSEADETWGDPYCEEKIRLKKFDAVPYDTEKPPPI